MLLVVCQLNRDVIQDYVLPDDQTQPTFKIYIIFTYYLDSANLL